MGDITPAGLGDADRGKYDYYEYKPYNLSIVLAPITIALGKEMGYRNVLDATDNVGLLKLETDPSGFLRNFWCPSQGTSVEDQPQNSVLCSGRVPSYTLWAMERQSYVFNEAVLGVDDAFGRLKGKASRVRQPAITFFAADGLPETDNAGRSATDMTNGSGVGMGTLSNGIANRPASMGDALSGKVFAGVKLATDKGNFDPRRHPGQINVVFCDGHAETRQLTVKGLLNVWLVAP